MTAQELTEQLDGGLEVDTRDAYGRTLLMVACQQGAIELVELLLKRGAAANARSPAGTTPLMYAKTSAFAKGNMTMLTLLLDNGADISAVDNLGKTAIEYSIENSEKLIAFLQSHRKR